MGCPEHVGRRAQHLLDWLVTQLVVPTGPTHTRQQSMAAKRSRWPPVRERRHAALLQTKTRAKQNHTPPVAMADGVA